MKNLFFVYIETDLYLAQFITKHFGVSFPEVENGLYDQNKKYIELARSSPEYKLLCLFLDKMPPDKTPERPSPSSLAIRIPLLKDKDPRYGYTYLSDSAKNCLITHFKSLLDAQVSKDFLELITFSPNIQISEFADAWCDVHGIDTDDGKAPETIRQKFYRMRSSWEKNNKINLI